MEIHKLFNSLLNTSYSLTHSSTVDYLEYSVLLPGCLQSLMITVSNHGLGVEEEEQFPKPVIMFISS